MTDHLEALRAVHAAASESESDSDSEAGVDMPPLETLEGQLEELRSRLAVATGSGGDRDYRDSEAWSSAEGPIKSGAVIMKPLFTDKKLYEGLGDILFLFQHCALKTRNEAVVEGMGSIVSMHADPRRGLSAEAYEKEAFIHYNGPTLSSADGRARIIKEALDIHFIKGTSHFTKESDRALSKSTGSTSKVIQRHKEMKSKLPYLAD